MTKLLASLEFPRVAAYAAIAALVTGTLFAADGAYRWYGAGAQVAAPAIDQQSVETPGAAPVEAAAAVPGSSRNAEAVTVEQRPDAQPVKAQAPNPAGGAIARPDDASTSNPTVATVPSGSILNSATGIVAETASRSSEVAPQRAQPPLPPQRPEMRSVPARQATRERAAPRRPVQAAEKPPARAEKLAEKPNVYWERDSGSQLGFAPQLRRKTCDPATGHMPMQCYYPREGRERFPAKPVN